MRNEITSVEIGLLSLWLCVTSNRNLRNLCNLRILIFSPLWRIVISAVDRVFAYI